MSKELLQRLVASKKPKEWDFDAELRKTGADFVSTAEALKAAGRDPGELGREYLFSYYPRFDWASLEQVAPYFENRTELLEEALGLRPPLDKYYDTVQARQRAFAILEFFAEPPGPIVEKLWSIALTGGKQVLRPAQQVLSKQPGWEARAIAALSDKKQEVRSASAEWLGRKRVAQARPVLETALKKEKHDLPKGAMMGALEQLGAPAEVFLDTRALDKPAQVPEALSWFDWDNLPQVQALSQNALQNLVLAAWKGKSPEPLGVLRFTCRQFTPAERRELGTYILERWIERDTVPVYTPEEVDEGARKNADAMRRWAPNRTWESLYRSAAQALELECKHTAIEHKGLLAVPAACLTDEAAGTVDRYLKRYYGLRAPQCKALLQMLAWTESSRSAAVLLGVARGFRTKGIQQEAAKAAQLLAERKGWSVAELADRSIPTAGLESDGTLTLDYGPRQFVARLDASSLKLELDGLSALPEPNSKDDPELAPAAKKLYSAAKKEVAAIVKSQRERLYQSMCQERTWSFEDWTLFLRQHPVVGPCCQSLVWMLKESGALFRPTAEGELLGADHDTVKASEGTVQLAHSNFVSPEQEKAWKLHFLDYKLMPLFPQFEGAYFLPEERGADTELLEFQGYAIGSFILRGEATKLGYVRAKSDDSGCFYEYVRTFPEMEVQAVISFSGVELPETKDVEVTLGGLSFADLAGRKLALKHVPAVLIAESKRGFERIATRAKVPVH